MKDFLTDLAYGLPVVLVSGVGITILFKLLMLNPQVVTGVLIVGMIILLVAVTTALIGAMIRGLN